MKQIIFISITIVCLGLNIISAEQIKNPKKAMFYSSILPGSGQYYNNSSLKGLLYFTTITACITYSYLNNRWAIEYDNKANDLNISDAQKTYYQNMAQSYRENRKLFIWLTSGIYFLNIVDAYIDAKLYNKSSVSTQKRWHLEVNKLVFYFN